MFRENECSYDIHISLSFLEEYGANFINMCMCGQICVLNWKYTLQNGNQRIILIVLSELSKSFYDEQIFFVIKH